VNAHSAFCAIGVLGSPRLLAGLNTPTDTVGFAMHEQVHGPLARFGSRANLERVLLDSGLRGRGGAGFPLGRKIATLAKRRNPVVVVNASEGEPLSRKDVVLLGRVPHLVIDGAIAVADAIDAGEVVIYLHEGRPETVEAVRAALAERRGDLVPVRIVEGPARYVAGEASAAISFISGGEALPTKKPPQPTDRGVRGRPTVLSNAETFAHTALIVRHGAQWFRSVGVETDPGTVLLTVTDGTTHVVIEAPTGTPLSLVVNRAGGSLERAAAVLLGGYAGTWATPDQCATLTLDRNALSASGFALGVGQIALLPSDACYLSETARISDWLAGQTAGQCGPCVHGLPDIAAGMRDIATRPTTNKAAETVWRWADQVDGRGACAHPGGVSRLVRSALALSPEHLAHHQRGLCRATRAAFPIPGVIAVGQR